MCCSQEVAAQAQVAFPFVAAAVLAARRTTLLLVA
jgi:hypothetical protein